ncbi:MULTISPECIES: DUF5777 family beta-barrel protein [unclassified Arcicella]|uniref:DUF5777 family beta-barrel protein n=1 Tax=unclassified Arcicella TaxID=2644986 RepID=UPI0028572D31|nr:MULTISPECIES: DUF5777 family beta-barrel protein [unclassified Arcicella]MDR6563860.1 hypothetical protein [Arcicella sp. BE51]MDR6813613.1 hypothetical protein [Arcicella sp. BE140]MDR6825006.1 hypothetical protein [Arcicella sp. BE139]
MKKYLLVFSFLLSFQSFCQDDLMDMLNKQSEKQTEYTTATFKATRLINGQTIETVSKNHLNFWISHRFGAVNSGFIDNFFGLDEARIRLGLEYGLSDNLTIGLGRSSQEKTYDYYLKYKAIRQSNHVPVTVTGYLSGATNTMITGYTLPSGSTLKFNDNLDRQTYCGQILIARKFSEKLSLQVMPTIIHFNKTEVADMKSEVLSLGFGGRYKLSKRLSLNAEYYLTDHGNSSVSSKYHNSLAIGFDIETGGHVFQLHFTNSRGMIERHFIAQTLGQWSNADIFYGFNISRTFSFDGKSNKKKN